MSTTPFDDRLPEEQVPFAQEMLTLLPSLLPAPAGVSAEEQEQMLARVRLRLQDADSLLGLPEEADNEQSQVITRPATHQSYTPASSKSTSRRSRFWRLANAIAAVLVIGLITGAASVFFNRHPTSTRDIPPGSPAGTPGGAALLSSQLGGLDFKFNITDGPYFLSELLAVDITLTNHRQQDVMLDGSIGVNTCNGAFSALISGGQEPHYDLPTINMISCPPGRSSLAAGKSLTVHGYIPITRSGNVTITAQVRISTLLKNQNGTPGTWQISISSGEAVATAITVTPQIPSDRTILLERRGEDILVNAPVSVRSHLLFFYIVSCLHGSGTNVTWEPLLTTKLSKPYCDDASRHWVYAVGAPGYAIASMAMDS